MASLKSHSGNVTGFANFGPSVGGERLRLLAEIAPEIRRAMIVFEADSALGPELLRSTVETASTLKLAAIGEGVRDFNKLESDVASFARQPNGGLVVVQGPFTTRYRIQIVGLSERHRLPAVYPLALFVEIGGLVSHGVNVAAMWESAAEYISRILRGARPGDLVVQEPQEPEIVLNLSTAKKLGLGIGPSLRGRATRIVD